MARTAAPRRARAAGDAGLDARLEAHRAAITRKHRVRSADQLVKMVDEVGFCFAFTLRTGDAPLPAGFDHLSTNDEGRKWGWMWEWKDELAADRRLYYGTLLVRKPTFVSLRLLPTFYATFGRAGEPDDHLEDVKAGRLSDISRRIIEFLGPAGETQTKRMRAALGIVSKEGKRDYDKAIDEVQRLMYVARARAVGEGREDYNYTYDLFVRRYPDAVKRAERISSHDATRALLEQALALSGALTEKQVTRLFEWGDERTARTIERLESERRLVRVQHGRETLLVLPSLA
ncbi:MAG TPA: crosslink repair DNA glycosylase YcaQ family protein [Candidatus Limnocylindria bacterium]|nr:crosslink repair DNA glycosylase YcaQ family protein [Candidatus Limnocylindria bacterium]